MLCLTPIIILVLLPILILLIQRWLSMRGLKSRYEMDGAVCRDPEVGNVVIRRTRARNFFLLLFLGAAGVGLIVVMVLSLWNLVTGEGTGEQLENFAVFPVALLIVWGAVYLIARSAFLPAITFDQERRAMIIGRGRAAQQIPYTDIASVEVTPVQDRIGGLAIYVVQHNGKRIKLGTLTRAGMDESAVSLAHLISRETGPQVQLTHTEKA
jgi:hypothetical protein